MKPQCHAPRAFLSLLATAALLTLAAPSFAADAEGFVPLFNGRDLTGWKVPAGDNGHWKVVDGVIDYDAESEASGDKSLATEREYGDYTLPIPAATAQPDPLDEPAHDRAVSHGLRTGPYFGWGAP
jgi:hypothetical protein